MLRKLIPIALLCVAAWAQAEDKIIGGPMVVNVGQKSATLVWVVESHEIRVGPFPGVYPISAPALRAEKVGLTSLEPGKKYYYEIPGADGVKGYFKTAPEKAEPFMFVVYGDTRTRHELHQKIADAVSATDPDFIVFRKAHVAFRGGDNDGFARGGRTEVLGQVHLDGQDVTLDGHLDVFHAMVPFTR